MADDQAASTRKAVLGRLATLDRLHREAVGRVYAGVSADRTVQATVDGTGRLLDLTIDPPALRADDPEQLGPHVVAAVTRAREAAAAARVQRVRQELGRAAGI